MITLKRTDSSDADFTALVKLLDAYLAIQDGDEHAFYDQYNKVTAIKYVIVAYDGVNAVGCGAIKELEPGVMEVKRMYVVPDKRGHGIAAAIVNGLEVWSSELGYKKCMLETGKKQTEALAFYPKCGYTVIPNYGQYTGIENSVCFEKLL